MSLLALLVPGATRAEISEPDNVLYGTLVIDGAQVSARRSDVVVEARRTPSGPVVAQYRMGSSGQAGDFYVLRIPVESIQPLVKPEASQVGDNLIIVVADASDVRAQASFTVAQPGSAQRIDFGGAVPDSDGDGLPDAWENFHFGTIAGGPNVINANGQTTFQNYTAGTDPTDTSSGFQLRIGLDAANPRVSFLALRAEGAGYEGRTRVYALEYTTNAGIGWQNVPGFTNLLGNNQTILFSSPATNAAFYRATVRLQGQ